MWFRRRRKADSDNELTETLRSLQTLLDEAPRGQKEENRLPPRPPEQPGQHVASPSPGTTAHSVVSEEHLTWDFEVDLSTEEQSENLPKIPEDESLEPLDDGGEALVAEISDNGPGESKSEVDSETNVSIGDDTTRDEPDTTSIDTIPVLNNIVFMPTAAGRPRNSAHTKHTPATLVDQCIDDFRIRLEQHALPALDPSREQRLRTFLTSLL